MAFQDERDSVGLLKQGECDGHVGVGPHCSGVDSAGDGAAGQSDHVAVDDMAERDSLPPTGDEEFLPSASGCVGVGWQSDVQVCDMPAGQWRHVFVG